MKMMGQLVQRNRPCSDVMDMIAAEDKKRGPYVPCPCGSGKKFRFCHGDPAPQSPFTKLSPIKAAPHDAKVIPFHAELPRRASPGDTPGAAE
jgi:uncharacterized protein